LYIEIPYRWHGAASALMGYVEENSKKNGAKALRSSTGSQNFKSLRLHEKAGFYVYRYKFEKLIR
jgi:hypothetical protein